MLGLRREPLTGLRSWVVGFERHSGEDRIRTGDLELMRLLS